MIRFRMVWLAVVVAAALATGACRQQRVEEWRGATILISLDGFRWDYRELAQTPALDTLVARGVVGNLRPSFPTKTFPVHHTIATGLHPNRHGVVGNTMYDPDLDARFSMGDSAAVADGRWWGGEPIWATVERAGLTAATFFWPGSEAEINGIRPTYWKSFDETVSPENRLRQILAWLELPLDRRPSFLTLYFSDVDAAGHRFGPGSAETRAAIERVDAYVDILVDGLEERALERHVNVVVVSDHGMSQLSPDRIVLIDDFVDMERAGALSLGQYVALWPKESDVDATFEALEGVSPALSVFRRGSIPGRLHLDGHPRTPPIIGLVQEGWSVSTRFRIEGRSDAFTGGGHGYDNKVPDMIGIFIAAGPAFRSGVAVRTLDAVDVYNVLAASIGVEPAKNDGNPSVLEGILEPVRR